MLSAELWRAWIFWVSSARIVALLVPSSNSPSAEQVGAKSVGASNAQVQGMLALTFVVRCAEGVIQIDAGVVSSDMEARHGAEQ